MLITPAWKSPDIAIKIRIDVIEFMKYDQHLLLKAEILKSRQAKIDGIKDFVAVVHYLRHLAIPIALCLDHSFAALEFQWDQLRLETVFFPVSGTRNANEYFPAVDVPEGATSPCDIGYQSLHMIRIIKHRLASFINRHIRGDNSHELEPDISITLNHTNGRIDPAIGVDLPRCSVRSESNYTQSPGKMSTGNLALL